MTQRGGSSEEAKRTPPSPLGVTVASGPGSARGSDQDSGRGSGRDSGGGAETTIQRSRAWGDRIDDAPIDLDRIQALVGERYRVECLAGTGGMSHVFAAMDLTRQRRVAVKVLRPGAQETEAETRRRHRRLIAEARAVTEVSHPGVCGVHEVGMDPRSPHIIMDWIDGVDLRVFSRGLDIQQRVVLFTKVVEGMAAVHDAGVIHGDLKPGNVMVRSDGLPVLLDFGLAMTEAGGTSIREATGGTPGYSAPEQFEDDSEVGPRSDVFALGVVLFEMMTDELPFKVGSMAAVLERMNRLDPPVPRDLNPSVPERLQRVCLTAMSREPGRRYASAGAMLTDLRRVLGGLEPLGRGGVLRELYADELVGMRDRVLYWLARGELDAPRAVEALGWLAWAGRREPAAPALGLSIVWTGVVLWSVGIVVGSFAGLSLAVRSQVAIATPLGTQLGVTALMLTALVAAAAGVVALSRRAAGTWSRGARSAVTVGAVLTGVAGGFGLVATAYVWIEAFGARLLEAPWFAGLTTGLVLGLLCSVVIRWKRPTATASASMLLAINGLWMMIYLWFARNGVPQEPSAWGSAVARTLGAELQDPRLGAWVAALGAVLVAPAVEFDRAQRRLIFERGRTPTVDDAWLWLWGAAVLMFAGLAQASVAGGGWFAALLREPENDERMRSAFIAGTLLMLVSLAFGSSDGSARRGVAAGLRCVGVGVMLLIMLVAAWNAGQAGEVLVPLGVLLASIVVALAGTMHLFRPVCWVGVGAIPCAVATLVHSLGAQLVGDEAAGILWLISIGGMLGGLASIWVAVQLPRFRASRRMRTAARRLSAHRPDGDTNGDSTDRTS